MARRRTLTLRPRGVTGAFSVFATALFGVTKRMGGRCAASQIASASAVSFFCRFTNGLT